MNLSSALAELKQLVGTSKPTTQTIVIGPAQNPSVLAQILQGIQAGGGVLTSYYQSQTAVNQARAEAEAAKYGVPVNTYQNQPYPTQTQFDIMPLIIVGGGLMMFMVLNDKKR